MRVVQLALLLLGLASAGRAEAFQHIVRQGETLSQIAARVYGDPAKEVVIAGANALDAQGGSAIVPGMRLELPAPGHHTAAAGETWRGLALTWLGHVSRADILAVFNHAVAWVDPPVGLAVEVPALIAHIASDGETSAGLAARYWGDANRGWELNAFNGRREVPLQRGEIVLVWLPGMTLTAAGAAEAAEASGRSATEFDTARLDVQRRADAELPRLREDVARGRYVDAVARGNRILGSGPLTRPQLAIVNRALLEGYVALEAHDAAVGACAAWRASDDSPELDPVRTSPKVRAACAR